MFSLKDLGQLNISLHGCIYSFNLDCSDVFLIMNIGFMLQNFLFTSKDDKSTLKAIDFGLSDYVKPGWAYCLLSILLFFY